jgi:hypothetical protein
MLSVVKVAAALALVAAGLVDAAPHRRQCAATLSVAHVKLQRFHVRVGLDLTYSTGSYQQSPNPLF